MTATSPCLRHQCHACCVGTRMTLTEREVARLKAAGHRNFCVVNRNGEMQILNRGGRCVFLAGGRCTVYDIRPEGCRFYPLVLDLDSGSAILHDFCPHGDEFEFAPDAVEGLKRSVAEEETEARRRRRRRRRAAGPLAAAVLAVAAWTGAQDVPTPGPLPWEVWKDLATLAVIPDAGRVLMRSSHCPDGCARDRHAAGDSRFLRIDGEEGVIFEASGPGAITRIWMTQGDRGVSLPLDPDVWIRIVVDGEIAVQLPLPDLFGGAVAPFAAPLVAHRPLSGGGNISHVPIPYRESCRVSLLGAEEAKIWFQITYHELTEPAGIDSFSGEEDLAEWRDLLDSPGDDPWIGGPFPTASGEVVLRRGNRVLVAAFDGADVLNGLLLRVDRRDWPHLGLRLAFDDRVTVDLPLPDFYAAGPAEVSPTRSVMVGVGPADDLYCYFPMPFFERAVVQLSRANVGGRRKIAVEYAVRRLGRPPLPGSGVFGAVRSVTAATTPGLGHSVIDLPGAGRWVGLFAELGSLGGGSRDYLEGDERVFVDGGEVPALHGTGVEDFFGGGFYFRADGSQPTVFRRALHGMTSDRGQPPGEWTTSMYRMMLTDAPVWTRRVRAELEAGPVNQTPMRAKTVAYVYRDPVESGGGEE